LAPEWALKIEDLPRLVSGFESVETLTRWADHLSRLEIPHTVPAAIEANLALGERLMREPHAQAADACHKDGPWRLALALFYALRARQLVPRAARALLDALPEEDHKLIEIDGVRVPRADIEGLLRDPDIHGRQMQRGAVGRTIGRIHQGWGANVHLGGMLTSGALALARIKTRNQVEPPSLVATFQQILAQPAADDAAQAGLDHALGKTERIDEGDLHTDIREVLRQVWAYCSRHADETLREHLVAMFFACLRDIGREQPCNVGCVQRLLQVPEGIDPAFTPEIPEVGPLSEEITRLVALMDDQLDREVEADNASWRAVDAHIRHTPLRGEAILRFKLASAQAVIHRSLLDFRALPADLVAKASAKPLANLERSELYMQDLSLGDLSIDYRDHQGQSALQKAVLAGDVEAVRAQVAKGARADMPLHGEPSVLLYAARRGLAGIVAALAGAKGVDVNAPLREGMTLLMHAAATGNSAMVSALLSFEGVTFGATHDGGHTPLTIAARRGHAEAVRLLSQANGADPNERHRQDHTALMIAARWGRLEVVKALLDAPGIDVRLLSKDGKTARLIAAERKHEDIAELLEPKNRS
jgi:hypothetical protein